MRGLIRASMMNPWAVTVFALAIALAGGDLRLPDPDRHLAGVQEPRRPGHDVLQRHAAAGRRAGHHQPDRALDRHGGGPAAAGVAVDPGGEHRQELLLQEITRERRTSSVLSLAQSVVANLPPGTLPPVVMPFDPTSTTPVCLVALNSPQATTRRRSTTSAGTRSATGS